MAEGDPHPIPAIEAWRALHGSASATITQAGPPLIHSTLGEAPPGAAEAEIALEYERHLGQLRAIRQNLQALAPTCLDPDVRGYAISLIQEMNGTVELLSQIASRREGSGARDREYAVDLLLRSIEAIEVQDVQEGIMERISPVIELLRIQPFTSVELAEVKKLLL